MHVFNGQVFTLHVRAQKASRLTATSKEVLEMTDTRDVFEIRVRSCHHELQEMHMTVQGPGASPELSLTFALSQDLRHVHEEVCQHFDPLVPEWQSIVLTHGERVWLLRQGISPAVTLRQYCKDMLVPAAGARAESAASSCATPTATRGADTDRSGPASTGSSGSKRKRAGGPLVEAFRRAQERCEVDILE